MEPKAPGTLTTIEGTQTMLVIGNAREGMKDTAIYFIAARPAGGYAVWTPAEDKEFRTVLNIDVDADLPTIEVRPHDNTERTEAAVKKLQRYRKAGDLPLSVIKEVARETDARFVLVGWTGLAGPDGEVAYSPAEARKLFELDSRFHDAVVEAAQDDAGFRAESLADAAEALGNGSSGSSSGSRTSKGSKTRG